MRDKIKIAKETPEDKALKSIKYILNNCATGKEAEAILFAIQFNKITGVTWSK